MDLATSYSEILQTSNEMVAAARLQDWQQLAELGKKREKAIQALPAKLPSLPPQATERVRSAIHAIAACDEEIRSRVEPWMQHVRTLLRY